MRIAVLHGWGSEEVFDLSRVSILRILEPMLRSHSVTWLLGKHPSAATISEASECDLLLLTGLSGMMDFPTWELPGYWSDVAARPYAITDFALPFSSDGSPRMRLDEEHPLSWLVAGAEAVGVSDARTFEYLATLFGREKLEPVSFPESVVDETPVTGSGTRSVLIPGKNRFTKSFVQKVIDEPTWNFILEEGTDFESGVPAGIRTHFHPRFPQWHLRGVQSAKECISFRLSSALIAHGFGIPTVLLGESEDWARVAEAANLSFCDTRLMSDADEAWERSRALLSYEPDLRGEVIPDTRYSRFVGKLLSRFDDRRGLSLVVEKQEYPIDICCVSDVEYFPFFVALSENLNEVSRAGVSLHLLALDEDTARLARDLPEMIRPQVWTLSQLWSEEELKVLSKRPIPDVAYSSKSRLLRRVLSQINRPTFYFDLDLYFFRAPTHLVDSLRDKNILLFPQSCDVLRLLRWYGAFNAGMVGVSPGAERFLDWWASLCLHEYETDVQRGYYVDQGFLDLVPVYFPEAVVYRGHDENIACWNMTTHEVARSKRDPFSLALSKDRPLGSYHTVNPDRKHFFELKHGWDQLHGSFGPWIFSSATLHWNTLLHQRHYWLDLSRWVYLVDRLTHHVAFLRRVNWNASSDFFVRGWGRYAMRLLANVHYRTRRVQDAFEDWRSQFKKKKTSHVFWVELQKRLIVRRNEL